MFQIDEAKLNKSIVDQAVDHYGGYVCSRRCDIRACVELEGTMPGCATVNGYSRLSCYAKERIKSNWPEE